MLQESPAACPGLRAWDVPASYDEALLMCLRRDRFLHRWIEAAHVTVSKHEWLAANTRAPRDLGITFRSTERVVEQARLIKDTARWRRCAKLPRLRDVADGISTDVREGRRERHVAAPSKRRCARVTSASPSTRSLASGSECGASALPRRRPDAAPGDLVVLDFGGVWTDTAAT